MPHQNATPPPRSANPVQRDNEKRNQVKALALASATEEGVDCAHCDGTGTMPGGRRLVHSLSPSGFGADWDVESLHAAIDVAKYVQWVPNATSHALVVDVDGKAYRFEVPRPADSTGETS